MTDELGGVFASGMDEIALEMRGEFLDEVRDRIRETDVFLGETRKGERSTDDLVVQIRRLALMIYGQSNNFGLRLLGTVSRRLEDYLANVREFPPRGYDDLQMFINMLEDIIDGRISLDADASELVRRLPAKLGFSAGDIEVRNIEIMLVMLHGTATHFVEREMQQCGYRVVTVTSTFDALPLIVRTKPDMVIISAVMPELDGIDLAVALSSMPATRNIPVALITSLSKDDPHLQFLPKHVPIIEKGRSFADDLFKALDNLFLI